MRVKAHAGYARPAVATWLPTLNVGAAHACAGPAPGAMGRSSRTTHADAHAHTKAMPKRTDLKSILILGSGPIVIGQAAEFDYSGTQVGRALREVRDGTGVMPLIECAAPAPRRQTKKCGSGKRMSTQNDTPRNRTQ